MRSVEEKPTKDLIEGSKNIKYGKGVQTIESDAVVRPKERD